MGAREGNKSIGRKPRASSIKNKTSSTEIIFDVCVLSRSNWEEIPNCWCDHRGCIVWLLVVIRPVAHPPSSVQEILLHRKPFRYQDQDWVRMGSSYDDRLNPPFVYHISHKNVLWHPYSRQWLGIRDDLQCLFECLHDHVQVHLRPRSSVLVEVQVDHWRPHFGDNLTTLRLHHFHCQQWSTHRRISLQYIHIYLRRRHDKEVWMKNLFGHRRHIN